METTGKFYQEFYLTNGSIIFGITIDHNEIIITPKPVNVGDKIESRSIKWEDLYLLMERTS